MDEKLKGDLIIIGGAEDKKGDKSILKEVCGRIDKKKDELVIATVASGVPEELGIQYKNIFQNLGVKNVSILNVRERKDAFDNYNLELIKKASVVFFTGGDQLRITSLLGGTDLYKMMNERYEDGCTYVGTSAGASAMSDTMIVTGPEEESPKKCTLKMAPGLGLIKGVIIDQHFAQRGRIGRLLVGIAENPQSIGIGIDEDTAIVVNNEAKFKVLGSGAVYVIDGSKITDTNVSEQNQDEILSIFNIKMHVLKKDDKFDLNRRTP
ncbi:cyanophycinase [Clostridium tetanomorphum]|uniref:Cyanophycinase n=1 Tax=Clostridium tetanomorphum TaxID=1553 RepID=A0A923J2Z9_CLOTT|nr:cyanophycinase [Clostridium tetanomorphum]KAJ53295.1 cyanophycinase [Clostridium tetanomorphum DSM 665]MBC2399415.1 cyanophycinase [Clostridium tetanomorphum]MBP1865673.1 cyanophycinase [Clostridium tetanomorphum]NRS86793.1 cyanophycinase [Clostridium tetanomorphum]NRZ99449.1 cyanophycinase [Clostridium tetanomorphum]